MIKKSVSVIIPIYNGSNYISSLLSDLQKQHYRDFEVIFIDDGSTDETLHALLLEKEQYEDEFNITVLHQENAGVSAARNTGIREAKGEYLCFVDVDDGLSPNYLSYMVKAISETGASLVFCKTSSCYLAEDEVYALKTVANSKATLYRFLFHDLVSGVWSLLVRKKVLSENNLFFKEGIKYSEDLHMVWRLIACSDKIAELHNKLYIYKSNYGSAMSKFDEERIKGIFLVNSLEGFFREKVPDFYLSFKKYAAARIAWAVLWQAAHFLEYNEFKKYIELYHFYDDCKMLYDYPQKYVAYSSVAFTINPRLFYLIAKFISRHHRSYNGPRKSDKKTEGRLRCKR